MSKKLVPYSAEWEKIANQMARSAAPVIYPCAECNFPVYNGYVCTSCGNTDPRKKKS